MELHETGAQAQQVLVVHVVVGQGRQMQEHVDVEELLAREEAPQQDGQQRVVVRDGAIGDQGLAHLGER